MANEYLKRTPTSTGNRKVWTWAGWVKLNFNATTWLLTASPAKDNNTSLFVNGNGLITFFDRQGSDPTTEQIRWNPYFRDFSSWKHIIINADTTQASANDRVKCYVNGVMLERDETASLLNNSVNVNTPAQNQDFWRLNGSGYVHYIGAQLDNSLGTPNKNQFTDVFYIDGQQLSPDVFGYYKKGDGYISAGSTQATDFKKGQWVPKAPKVIKSVINARGGFGVNGFYLPMNDSTNFGADLHCAPNSIITLKGEDEPQPYYGAPTTTDAYVSQLREDPYKDYLVLAMPLISGGKESGLGDYSADIKGSGTNKVVKVTGFPTVSGISSSLFYGSALVDNNNINNYLTVIQTGNDFRLDPEQEDWTIEFWTNPYTRSAPRHLAALTKGSATANNSFDWRFYVGTDALDYDINFGIGGDSGDETGDSFALSSDQWSHIAVEAYNGILTKYVNGVAVGVNASPRAQTTNHNNIHISRADVGGAGDVGYVGAINDIRIYSGVAKYKGGFDVPKPYTPVGIGTWRAVSDTCKNNFATLNTLHGSTSGTYTNGNLTIGNPGTANIMEYHPTIGMTQGKWYCEARVDETSGNNHWHFGVSSRNLLRDTSNQNGSNAGDLTVTSINDPIYRVTYEDHNAVSYNGGSPSDRLANGDIVGVAVSITTPVASAGAATTNFGTVQFYRNGSTYGNELPLYRHQLPLTGVGGTTPYTREWFFAAHSRYSSYTSVNFGQNPTFSGNTTAGTYTDSNGKGLFKYQPPSGFLALCEDNLPTPAIADPGKHFKTVLYTGDGNNGRSITGLGFKPDLVWIKSRNATGYHQLMDSVRGAGIQLYSNDTLAEASGLFQRSFDEDGFSISWNSSGATNQDGRTYVAWCWRAGAGTTSTNTDGSIQSVVSVNQDAGFSIVSYTGNNTDGATVAHGLGKTPALLITKSRDNTQNPAWHTSHVSLPTNYDLALDSTTAAWNPSSNGWHELTNSSVFTLKNGSIDGHNVNRSGDRYIAYCWAEIEGFSKFGSYLGNLNADGPFVYCGFKPAWVMIKRTDNTSNWNIRDSSRNSTNPTNLYLLANLSDPEGVTSSEIDFLSNGFKIRSTSTAFNASGGTYIFAAFAESPFKTANSK